MAFKIDSAAVEDTGILHINDARGEPLYDDQVDGEPQPVTVTLYGPGSETAQKARARQAQRLLQRMRRKGSKGGDLTPAEQREINAEYLADITHGWGSLQYGDGTLTGRDLSLAIYGDARLGFIASQADRYQADWGNFSKG